MASVSVPPAAAPLSDDLIQSRIEGVRRGLWRSELTRSLLTLLLGGLALLLVGAIVDHWIWSPGPLGRTLIIVTAVVVACWWVWRRLRPLLTLRIDRAYAAYAIERDLPELNHALTSYVTLRDDRAQPGLRGVVVRSIGAKAAGSLNSHAELLPSEMQTSFRLWIAVAAALAVLGAYAVVSPKNTFQSASRLLMPLASIEPPTRVQIGVVEPGDVEVLAGNSVPVTVSIQQLGRHDVPQLELRAIGESLQRIELQPDAENRELYQGIVGQANGLQETTHYTVVAGDARSRRYTIDVHDVPVVNVVAVRYQPPAYTSQPSRTRSAAAIEGLAGTRVTLEARTNRPVVAGKIEFNPREVRGRVTAAAGEKPVTVSEDGKSVRVEFVLRADDTRRGVVAVDSYRLLVEDAAGTENPEPVVYPIRVLPDLAPEVTIAVPTQTTKDVPVDAQQLIEVRALDPDFGLTMLQVKIDRGVHALDAPVLWQNKKGVKTNQIGLMRFRPADWKLQPGHEVTITAIAKDNRHDIDGAPAPNVTLSDPITLRIVQAARMSEQQPAEDGLTAPDEKPTVDPSEQQGSEGAGSEGAGSEGAGSEGAGSEGAGSEGAGSEGAGSEGAGSEGAGSEGAGSEGARSEGAGSEGAGSEGAGSEGAGSEGAGSEGAGSEGAGSEGAGSEGAGDAMGRQSDSSNATGATNANGGDPSAGGQGTPGESASGQAANRSDNGTGSQQS